METNFAPQPEISPFEKAKEKLNVTDLKEGVVVDALVGAYHRSNTLLLYEGSREEMKINDAIVQTLEHVLSGFGRPDLINELKKLRTMDYSQAIKRIQRSKYPQNYQR